MGRRDICQKVRDPVFKDDVLKFFSWRHIVNFAWSLNFCSLYELFHLVIADIINVPAVPSFLLHFSGFDVCRNQVGHVALFLFPGLPLRPFLVLQQGKLCYLFLIAFCFWLVPYQLLGNLLNFELLWFPNVLQLAVTGNWYSLTVFISWHATELFPIRFIPIIQGVSRCIGVKILWIIFSSLFAIFDFDDFHIFPLSILELLSLILVLPPLLRSDTTIRRWSCNLSLLLFISRNTIFRAFLLFCSCNFN